MGFRERVTAWRLPHPVESSLALSKLPDAAVDVRRRLGTPSAEIPSPTLLREVANTVLDYYRNGRLSALPRRLLKYVPWALFVAGDEGSDPIANERGLLPAVLQVLEARGTARAGIALAYAYLLHYGSHEEHIETVRVAARKMLKQNSNPRATRMMELSASYGLLEGKGHPRFVEVMLQSGTAPPDLLADAGLGGELAYSGFVEHAFRHLCQRLGNLLFKDRLDADSLRRLSRFALAQQGGNTELRFGPRDTAGLINAFLEPFEHRRDPSQDLKLVIKDFALQRFGDPRLKPQNWSLVSAAAMAVMRRWLVAATLEDFFRILDENTERYADADRQWPYRRAFWTAYLARDAISDAWVALGWRARADSRLKLQEISARYAELSGGRPDHAVLIMQLDDLVITEWSHSGKYRIWHTANARAPAFYKPRYHRDELVDEPDHDGSHHGAENGKWQGRLAEYIHQQTGMKLGLRELMPR